MMRTNYYYLDNIEPKDIENALKENKIIKMHKDESQLQNLMNCFIGNKYSDKDINMLLFEIFYNLCNN